MSIYDHLSALLAGFSIIACLVLLFSYLFFMPDMRKTSGSKIACLALLVSLALLQVSHYLYFVTDADLLNSRFYCSILMIIPPSFFFFGRVVLFPEVNYRPLDVLHWLPAVISIAVATKYIPGMAFLFGTAYTFAFAREIYKLRDQRGRFKFEMFFFGLFALMAFGALVLGLSLPIMGHEIFYLAYGNAISIAMLLIVSALLIFPELLSDILLITEMAYAKSKLDDIDIKGKIIELEQLMDIEKSFQNEDLGLTSLAELLDLSGHQLSELINTQYGYGFPRFIREHRVKEAKSLLINEAKASVLSISMMTGFKSQSNFYTAFKELTGESPGNYRTTHSISAVN